MKVIPNKGQVQVTFPGNLSFTCKYDNSIFNFFSFYILNTSFSNHYHGACIPSSLIHAHAKENFTALCHVNLKFVI
jgi:hypothetical protein